MGDHYPLFFSASFVSYDPLSHFCRCQSYQPGLDGSGVGSDYGHINSPLPSTMEEYEAGQSFYNNRKAYEDGHALIYYTGLGDPAYYDNYGIGEPYRENTMVVVPETESGCGYSNNEQKQRT